MRIAGHELRGRFPLGVDFTRPWTRNTTNGEVTGYINAGGKGARLTALFPPDAKTGISKALLEVGTPPIPLINHHINRMARVGISSIIAGVGDHHNVAAHVRSTFADKPNVHAIQTAVQLGNGGDLLVAAKTERQLFAKDVLIANCDTILDINEAELLEQHRDTGAGVTIALTKNKGVPNEGAFYVAHNTAVVYCAEVTTDSPPADIAEYTEYRASSTGMVVVKSELLQSMRWSPEDGPLSLYRDIAGFALDQGELSAYDNGHKLFIDVGTVATWNHVQEHPETVQAVLDYGY